MSNYEQYIMQLLLIADIKFEREKTFNDLKQGKFRYDFWIPGRNVIIEVNGQQHYEQVKHFQHSRSDFLHAQENDRRKISYALANNYQIYCIPYWEIDEHNLMAAGDIFQEKYRAKSRWKNDEDWRERKKK